jgi:hypothetical protein
MEAGQIPFRYPFTPKEGFFPDQLEYSPEFNDSIIEGNGGWFWNGVWVSDRGTSSAGSTGGLADLQVIGGQNAGCSGVGNIWRAFSTLWTTGAAFLNGSSLGNAAGVLSLQVGGVLTPAGLATPNAPTFAASATAGRLNGPYSAVVQAYRATTGARSSRSASSATISVSNKKGTLTFPSPVSGQTHWIIGGSIRAIPQGPWYRLTNQVIVPISTLSIEIDWVNGELGALMAINYDQPPASTHCAATGSVMLALGTGSGGYGCRPSILAQPEAFPLEYGFDLPVRESITGVQPGIDGVVLVSTANGLMGLLLSGADLTPILARVIFGNVGFARANAFCAVYDQIYGLSTKAGLVRTHGGEEPDSSWARPVQKYLERNGFTSSNSVVVFDQSHDAVIVASGTKAVPYMRASGRWSAPIPLPGTVTAGVALNGAGVLQIGSSIYSLDSAGAGGNWFLRTPYFGNGFAVLQTTEYHAAANSNITFDLLVPDATFEAGTSIGGLFPKTIAAPYGANGAKILKPNRKFRAVAHKASGTTGGQTPVYAEISGYQEPIAA